VPERVTQGFVGTLGWCWGRPALTGLEVLWRWMYGVPALWLVWVEAGRVLVSAPLDYAALRAMTLLDPMRCSVTLAQAMVAVGPLAWAVVRWLGPLLVMAWVVVSSVGRVVVMRRLDAGLRARVGTTMALTALRLAALFACFAAWFGCLQGAVSVAITQPIAHGEEPSLVLYFGLAIAATLGLFTLWAVGSWGLSVAPIVAAGDGLGAWGSLRAAFGPFVPRMKLVEINLVLGIVKIALIVLAMVLSASPLPFEAVASREFLTVWWCGVAVLYFVASDFFHVARLKAYLELWRSAAASPNLPR
jgi:hypothetical protein